MENQKRPDLLVWVKCPNCNGKIEFATNIQEHNRTFFSHDAVIPEWGIVAIASTCWGCKEPILINAKITVEYTPIKSQYDKSKSSKNRYKNFRERLGISQTAAAEQLGITQGAVWQWENGKSNPSAEILPKIAKLYNCSVDELLCTEESA